MNNRTVGRSSYKIGDIEFTDNYMPIELTWEGLLTDAEMRFVETPMPVIRKNYKDAALNFAVKAAELDQLDMLEKQRQQWQESLIIRLMD
jgi:hypothetical protein